MTSRHGPASILLLLPVIAMLAACGGSVVPTNGAQNRNTSSTGNLIISGSISGTGPQLLAHVRRLAIRPGHPMAFTFKSYSAQATLFPGDAGDNIVTNTGAATFSGGIYKASISLSNVPVHDNEWAILQFTGVATDGSQIALGELAGLINVTASPTNSSTLTEATTQTFQVFATLASNGEIATYDLDKTSTLASTLASDISATGIKPDPTTLLFDANELNALYNDIAPKFERNATISASPAVSGSFLLLRDYTNASELFFASNLFNFFSTFALNVQLPVIGGVFGGSLAGCGSFEAAAPLHEPETNPTPVPSLVNSCVIPESGSTTIHNVYGGHLLIGASNNPFNFEVPAATPFDGGFTSFAGHAPGTFATTVTTASTQQSIKVTDPAGFAFGAQFFASQGLGTFFTQPGFGNTPLSAATFTASVEPAYRILIPALYSSTNNTLIVDTLDPWDISAADTQLCGGVSCFALTAAQPFVIQRPFADAGTKLTYFAWKATGTASGISQLTPNPPGGYNVTISGAGTATLTTSTASVLEPRQVVLIEAPTVLPGSTWTITAKDAAGNTYTDSAPSEDGLVTITMDSVGNTVTTKSIAISFTTTAAGSITIGEIIQE